MKLLFNQKTSSPYPEILLPGGPQNKDRIGFVIRQNGVFMEVVSIFNGNTLIQGDSNYGFGLCLVANSFNFGKAPGGNDRVPGFVLLPRAGFWRVRSFFQEVR